MKKRDVINLSLLVIILIVGYLLHINRTYDHTRNELKLDTYIEISLVSKNKNIDTILDSVFTLIEYYDKEFSYYRSDSRLFEINESANNKINLTPEYYDILELGRKAYERSNGLFDLTIGPLTDIWSFDNEVIPSLSQIEAAKAKVGFDKIEYDKDVLIKPGSVKLNFGGIAKGYIIDRIVEFLDRKEIVSGIINIGGDIFLFGQEKPISVGIQHPRKERNEIIDVIKLQNNAVVTSGDYERFFIQDGVRYHHIINPDTGYPAVENLSVTVIAETATIADVYSTAIFLMNREDALKLIDQLDGLEALIYYTENDSILRAGSKNIDKYLIN
ncbi:FAD:protein FMN transferase [Candidatus Cloacimonadota bacterium]